MKAGWIVAVCVCLCANRIRAINLNNIDIQEPILRVSPAAGVDVDLFGYSVTAHQIQTLDTGLTDPDAILQDALEKTRIIIGAPKGTYPGGLDLDDPGLPASNQSGLVFSCPISPGQCEGVTGDPARDAADDDNDGGLGEGRLFDHRPASEVAPLPGLEERPFEDKIGQLLGTLVLSTGENVLVCAPRWTELVTQGQLPLGRCYITDRDLTNVRGLQPCSRNAGRPIEAVGQGYCTAGVGAVVTDDLIAMGAPGFDQLKGALWFYDSRNLGTGLNVGQIPVLGNFSVPDSTGTLVTINDIYLGYRITSGYISSPRGDGNRVNIIATVPRYNQTQSAGRYGRVLVYDVPSPPTNDGDVLLMATAEGVQIGEFFGYSVITADLDGDNYDDLLVGAPMYTDIARGKVESGRVYIFNNQEGTLNSTAIILEGNLGRGRLGSSLTNLGDVDNDGYEDFAVGAPYAASGSNGDSGRVFVYYGRSDVTRIAEQEPFEITAEDMVSQVDGLDELKTFGWSLSGGVDVDANEYNDLVIGAYDSQAVFVLRSIPVADVYVELVAPTLQLNLEGGNVCRYSDGRDYPCFVLTIRGNYSGRGLDGSLTVNYTLSEVVSNEQRLFFNMSDMPNQYSGEITFSDTGVAAEDMLNVLVFSLDEISSLATLVLDFQVEQIYRAESMGDGNQTVTSLRDVPRLRQLGDARLEVRLVTNCGVVCNADLELTNVNVDFQNQDLTDTVDSFVAGTVGRVDFTISYQNSEQEDALRNVLEFDIPGIFDLSVNSPNAPCAIVFNPRVRCQLQDRLTEMDMGQNVIIRLTVNQSAVIGNEVIQIDFTIRTINSEDTNTDNNMDTTTFSITAAADIFVGVTFSPVSIRYIQGLEFPPVPNMLEDLGTRDATLSVTVSNDGPSTIQNSQLTVFFPAVSGTNDYLYPFDLDILISQGTAVNCNMSGIDRKGLVTSATDGSRRRSLTNPGTKRRRREAIASLVRKPRQTGGSATELNCERNIEACLRIDCDITSLRALRPIIITITGRVNEQFFTNQDSDFSLLAYANVSITDVFIPEPEQGNRENSDTAELVLIPPLADSGEDDSKLIHSIIWPILGGVLLFVLLAVLLYFCGFFRRKKKPEDQQAEGDFDANKFNVQPVDEKNVEGTNL